MSYNKYSSAQDDPEFQHIIFLASMCLLQSYLIKSSCFVVKSELSSLITTKTENLKDINGIISKARSQIKLRRYEGIDKSK